MVMLGAVEKWAAVVQPVISADHSEQTLVYQVQAVIKSDTWDVTAQVLTDRLQEPLRLSEK
jgi:hypothetical protein